MKIFGSIHELVSLLFRKNSQEITLQPSQTTTYTANRAVSLPPQDADTTLASIDATQTLTNKTLGSTNTLTGATAASFTNTGTVTLFTASDTVVGKATTDTLTNKSISGSTNTITNVSLTSGVTGTLPIANGGSGQITKAAAFDALSPSSTKGDLIGYSSTNARLGVGSDGQVLTADAASTLGVKWAASAGGTDSPEDMKNLALATSVAANALTIALKTKAAADPSAGDAVTIAMRNSTSATGTYNIRSVTGALSLVVPSGATLGTLSAMTTFLYVYALDNAGTIELAISGAKYDSGSVQSTTTMSAGATSYDTLYSTTGRSNVPIHVIGRIKVTEATAGTWASNATEVVAGSHFVTGGILGLTSGKQLQTTYVGEIISDIRATSISGTTGAIVARQITLTPGIWQVTGGLVLTAHSGFKYTAIISNANDLSEGFENTDNGGGAIGNGYGQGHASVTSEIVVYAHRLYVTTTNTTIFLVGSTSDGSTSYSARSKLIAVRIG